MKKSGRIVCLVLIAILAVAGVVFSVIRFEVPNSYNIFKGFANSVNLGKDFDGGVMATYESSTEISKSDLNKLTNILGQRATIIKQSGNKIIVDIPNANNPSTVMSFLGEEAAFKICKSGSTDSPIIDATGLKSAEYYLNGSIHGVLITFTDEATRILDGLDYSSDKYYIYIGSTPMVALTSRLSDVGFLSAETMADAQDLADKINAGRYSKDMTLESADSYNARFGENSFMYVQIAYAIALVALITFLCVSYRMMGMWTAISMVLYSVVFLLIFGLAEIEFNTASVIGVLLGYVFTVFAHLFMFRNFKKEYANGKKISSSVKLGFKKSYSIILDVAIVVILSLIAPLCFTSVLRSFALSLMIMVCLGVICTLGLTYGMVHIYLPLASSRPKQFGFKREVKNNEK